MMKYILSIYLTITYITANSQVNFFQTGASWGYTSNEHPDTPFDPYRTWIKQYEVTGDVTINAVSYKILQEHSRETDHPGSQGGADHIVNYNFSYAIRFDSLNDKVYSYDNSSSSDYLLFNFNPGALINEYEFDEMA